MQLSDFSEEEQIRIKYQAGLPGIGQLRSKIWAIIGGPKLTTEEIQWLSRSTPSWAVNDAILMASIKRSIEWDSFLMKVASSG